MQFKTVVSISVLAAATLGLTVACGKSDSKAPVTRQQKEENIQAGLLKLTGGKYNPGSAENMKLAGQLEASSATVQKLHGKDDKSPVWGVRVRFLLKGLPEIAAQKELGNSQGLEALQNDQGIPSKYMIEAVCGGTDCDRVTAILSEKAEAGSGVEASRIAVIFKREKTLAEQKQLAEKNRQAKANGKTSDDKEKSAVLEFDETKPQLLKVFWSAGAANGGLSGGVKKTIEELEGTEILKAHQAAKWPEEQKKIAPDADASGTGNGTENGAGTGTGAGAVTGGDSGNGGTGTQGQGDLTPGLQREGGTSAEPAPSSTPLEGSAPMGQGGIGKSI